MSASARPSGGRAALPRGGVAQRQEGFIRASARPSGGRAALPWGGVAQRQEGNSFPRGRPEDALPSLGEHARSDRRINDH
jgi:hypothetical protein